MARSRALLLVLVVSLLAQFVGGLPVVAAAAWTAGPTAPPWPAPDPMHGPVKADSRATSPLPPAGSAKRAELDRLQGLKKAETDRILARERPTEAKPAAEAVTASEPKVRPLGDNQTRDFPHPACAPIPGQPQPWHPEYFPGAVTLGNKYGPGRVQMRLVNHGSQTWQPGQVSVGYHRMREDNTEIDPGSTPLTKINVSVPPQGSVTVDATFAFLPPGQHLIAWDLHVAGVGWLSTKGICTFVVRYTLPNQPPSVTVQYPPNGGTTTTRTPLLTVHGDDPDAWPNRELQWQFRMCEDAALTVGCHVSAWTAFPWHTVPQGLLDWNETFYWSAKATDGSATTDPFAMGLPAHRVTVVVPAPDQWRTVGAGLGVANFRGVVLPYGIWTRTETDAQVGATGMPLRVQRTFSSGAPANHQGAFGQGWLSMFDAEAVRSSDGGTLTITYPDGRQEIFGRRADGSFVSRVDSGATNRVIVGQDGLLIVRTSGGEVVTYDSSGRFTRVAVEGGGALRMERDGGGQIVGVVQEPSGRRLDIRWTGQNPEFCTARPRIAAIETTAPAAGQQPLRWEYRYGSGSRCNHLTQRVDPTGQITTYKLPDQYGERNSEFIQTPEHRLVGGVQMGPGHGWLQNPDQGWEVLYVYGWTPAEGRFEVRVTRPLPGHIADWTGYHNQFGGPLVEICEGTFNDYPQNCASPQVWYFDELNRLRSLQHRRLYTDPPGAERVWFYDANNGRFTSFFDENFNVVSMQYDAAGNLKGSYTFRDDNTQVTRTSEFHLEEEGYPHLVGRMWWQDVSPRQGEHWAPFEMFTYDEAGRLARRRGNPTPEAPDGPVTSYTYTVGTEPSVGGPRDGAGRPRPMPRGLLRTVTTAAGTTTMSYNPYGDLAELVDPVGLRTTFEYDRVGRRTSQTVYSDSVPNGARTEYRYDAAGRITQQIEPAVRNEVTGETQQKRTCTSYDRDGNPRYVREMSSPCVDADGDGWWDDAPGARSMLYVYDAAGRPSHVHNIVRGDTLVTTKLEYAGGDRLRRVTDDVGRVTEFAYDSRKRLTEVSVYIGLHGLPTTTRRVVAAYGYDPAGRLVEETDALGRRTQHEWTDDDLPRRSVRAGVELSSTEYDGAGRVTKRSARGEPTRHWVYDSEGKPVEEIVDQNGLNRRLRFTYDPAGRVTAETLTDGARTEQTRYAYDAAGHLTEQTVENGDQDLTTRYTRDQRGLPVRVVDPRGAVPGADQDAFATNNRFDALGRLARTEAPAVTVEKHGDTPRFERTVATVGYTLFGEVAQEKDPDGGITETEYDQLGRRTARVLPEAPGPDGTPVRPRWGWRYNDIGELLEETDPRGTKTTHTYVFPAAGPAVNDFVDIDGQQVLLRTTQRDWAGQTTSVTNAARGRTDYVYDVLGQLKEIREPYDPAEGYAANTYRPHVIEYDGRGFPYRRFTPAGDRWDLTVNNAGETTAVQAPGLHGPTRYAYDVAGRVTSVTDPVGRVEATDHDLAGRPVAVRHLAPNGAQLDRSGVEYDPAGNVVARTSPRGARSTYQVDALGRTTAITQPVSATESITTSAGYDRVGNLTRTTEGLNRTTWHTYNAWGLRTSTVEPATPTHPDPGERTWTSTYDVGGLPVRGTEPGGITVQRTFDELGRLEVESASGGGLTAAERRIGYDPTGNITSIARPDGTSQTFRYSSRGLLLEGSAVGGRGKSTYTYDAASRPRSRQDPSGRTFTFEWTPFDAPASVRDTATGETAGYRYEGDGALDLVYRPDDSVVAWDYDGRGRVSSTYSFDATSLDSEATYTYDADGNVDVRGGTRYAADGNGYDTGADYDYDLAGRLTRFADNGTGVTSDYEWDDAGNRVKTLESAPNAPPRETVATYDGRHRLTGTETTVDGAVTEQTTVTHTARGDLATVSGGGTATYDALGRLTARSGITYTYDSLDRVATRTAGPRTDTFAYNGLDRDPSIASGASGAETYQRGPAGDLLGVTDAAGSRSWPVTERRGDTQLWQTGSATDDFAGLRRTDPFGVPIEEAGKPAAVSYQDDWADPTTGLVNMHARWYSPELAQFTSRDPAGLPFEDGWSALNRYTYANANPVTNLDPDGHDAIPFLPGIDDVLGDLLDFGRKVGGWVDEIGDLMKGVGRGIGNALSWVGRNLGVLGRFGMRAIPYVGWGLAAYELASLAVAGIGALLDGLSIPAPGRLPGPGTRTGPGGGNPPAAAAAAPAVVGTLTQVGTGATWTETAVAYTATSRILTMTTYQEWWQQIFALWSDGARTLLGQFFGTAIIDVTRIEIPTIDVSRAVDQVVGAAEAAVASVVASADTAGYCGLTGTLLSCLAEVVTLPVGGGCAGLFATMLACSPRAPNPGTPPGVRETLPGTGGGLAGPNLPGILTSVTGAGVLIATSSTGGAGDIPSEEELLAQAEAARDALGEQLRAAGRFPGTVVGGYSAVTGAVAAACSGSGEFGPFCGEDGVVEELGGDPADARFTEARRPRNDNPVGVCPRCQGRYTPDQFPSQPPWHPGGPWSLFWPW